MNFRHFHKKLIYQIKSILKSLKKLLKKFKLQTDQVHLAY